MTSPPLSPHRRRSLLVDDELRHRKPRELLLQTDRRSRRSIVNVGNPWQEAAAEEAASDHHFVFAENRESSSSHSLDSTSMYGSIVVEAEGTTARKEKQADKIRKGARSFHKRFCRPKLQHALGQLPAIAVISLLNLMISIPFGVSYFPVGWANENGDGTGDYSDGDDGIHGSFPLPGKEALGIRMFLFATAVGQLAFAFKSKFRNAIGLQMVENVPFCHALCHAVIAQQGYGADALSTVMVLFGLSSVLVGAVFYILGRLELGRIVYFFPTHVLVGCIGGIGVFLVMTAIEVSINVPFYLNLDGLRNLWHNFHLFWIVLVFDLGLRALLYLTRDDKGRPRFPLLSPIYFCCITPLFYLGLTVTGIKESTEDYFFPSPGESSFTDGLADMWTSIDLATVSWTAVYKAIPTMVALAAFSLIHVPINIPAFAISTNVDTDMNAELIAHGYSNALSGMFGGLQNYMTYSNSVLYAKSGGEGMASSVVIAMITGILFVVGPQIATFIPRCMAGTLLLHIGIDLFLEGVYDSYGNYDRIEYAGIWVITIVMTAFGMTVALIAGVISALSTYAVQSITYHNPIRRTMNAATLRSSAWTRCAKSMAILDSDHIGRRRIFVIQLHGHLFFGNVAQLTDSIKEMLTEKNGTVDEPWIVIIDFGLVSGMDSSAAHAVAKLKGVMHRIFDVEHTIFVTGSGEGFPCEYALSRELSAVAEINGLDSVNGGDEEAAALFSSENVSGTNRVCHELDTALIVAENMLIARQDESLIKGDLDILCPDLDFGSRTGEMSPTEEKQCVVKYLTNLSPGSSISDIQYLASLFQREEYQANATIWKQGSPSDSIKLLVTGTLFSSVDGTDVTETIRAGNTLGELGLVRGMNRLSTVRCLNSNAVVYSLSADSWASLTKNQPRIARLMDGIVIHYLAHRVQHVSNRIFETRCLPI